jgi:methyl-accepting chemotaxis protein
VTLAILLALNLAIIGAVIAGLRLLMRRAVHPLLDVAQTMRTMAKGDLDYGRTENHRDDEVGDMTRAVETFRATAIQQQRTERDQALVVREISAGLDALAQGELTHCITVSFPGDFESLRSAYNRSGATLEQTLREVAACAARVSSGSAEIGAASSDLAQRNVHQAANVEETLAAMNQTFGLVTETAQSTTLTRATIEEVQDETRQSSEVVAKATGAMAEIEASSAKITQIVAMIDGISFQTSLLALNAGVEAARAGEAGRGFAVVASEVRALAQRCAEAAGEIKALISVSERQVEVGVSLVNQTGSALGHVINRFAEIRQQIEDISERTSRQAVTLKEISGTSQEIDRMTQQNAAMAEETDAAARNLANEARTLAALVSHFRIGQPTGPAEVWSKAA